MSNNNQTITIRTTSHAPIRIGIRDLNSYATNALGMNIAQSRGFAGALSASLRGQSWVKGVNPHGEPKNPHGEGVAFAVRALRLGFIRVGNEVSSNRKVAA